MDSLQLDGLGTFSHVSIQGMDDALDSQDLGPALQSTVEAGHWLGSPSGHAFAPRRRFVARPAKSTPRSWSVSFSILASIRPDSRSPTTPPIPDANRSLPKRPSWSPRVRTSTLEKTDVRFHHTPEDALHLSTGPQDPDFVVDAGAYR